MDPTKTNLKTFGARFRARRRQAGISQAMLAAAVGVERRVVIDVEQGRGTVAIGRVLRLAREIGLPMATLDDPQPAEPTPS
jgi:transcriptional regulator with XRE-family HTH domain